MNPFQFQMQMIEAWAGATQTMFTTALEVWSQAIEVANSKVQQQHAAQKAQAAAMPGFPMWPFLSFPQMPAQSMPMSFGMPSWPPSMPFSWPPQSGMWPSAMTNWPMASMMAPPSMMPFSPFSQPWWTMGMFGWQQPRVPVATAMAMAPTHLLEQMATSYRTASGYAAAAVLGPFGAPIQPKEGGVPFWMLPASKSRRDVN